MGEMCSRLSFLLNVLGGDLAFSFWAFSISILMKLFSEK